MGRDSGNAVGAFEPILRTKLHRPQLTAELIDRDRLITVMNTAHEVPLTLVAAPIGSRAPIPLVSALFLLRFEDCVE